MYDNDYISHQRLLSAKDYYKTSMPIFRYSSLIVVETCTDSPMS